MKHNRTVLICALLVWMTNIKKDYSRLYI